MIGELHISKASAGPDSLDRRQMDAMPAWVTPDLIQKTIRVWSPRCGKPLTTRDALEIVLNMGNLIDVLEAVA